MLSYLDRNDIAGNSAYYNTVALDVLTCPNDLNNFKAPNGLSYAANGGYGQFIWNGGGCTGIDEDVYTVAAQVRHNGYNPAYGQKWGIADGTALWRDTGVIWRSALVPDTFRMTFDRISLCDGLGQTLLLAENLNSRNWGLATEAPGAAYYAADSRCFTGVLDTAFVINIWPGDFSLGTDVAIALNPATAPLYIPPDGSLYSKGPTRSLQLNGNKGTLPGNWPFPTSLHPGIVVFAFCDGRAKAINESIDRRLYATLMTPAGGRRGQVAIGDNDY